jgi:hypothetical protein
MSAAMDDGNITGTPTDANTSLLTIPLIPLLYRSYLLPFFRKAMPKFHERSCTMNTQCAAIPLWHYHNNILPFKERNRTRNKYNPYLLAEAPFVVRELLFPQDLHHILVERSKGKPMSLIMSEIQPRACILCYRYLISLLANKQKSSIDRASWIPVQNHCNAFNEPGEYIAEIMLTAGYTFSGTLRAVVGYDQSHYVLGHCNVYTPSSEEDYVGKPGETTSDADATVIKSTARYLSTATTLLPINEQDGSILLVPPDRLTEDLCDEMKCNYVSSECVDSWLESSDIIYQPAKNESYIKSVIDINTR